MTTIPLIFHQIYEGRDGSSPSDVLIRISKTWMKNNPDYKYQFWDYKKIDQFLSEFYPDFIAVYNSFQYEVQRWDAIRYLILYHFGGVYVDLDYECLKSIESIVENKVCCLGMEPQDHCRIHNREYIVGNAFMAVEPENIFFKSILEEISNISTSNTDKFYDVLETTGPFMMTDLYKSYVDKKSISLIPAEQVAPLSVGEVRMLVKGKVTDEISAKIEKAYAIHYFFGSWCNE